MCVYSVVMGGWDQVVPHPVNPWLPQTVPYVPPQTAPAIPNQQPFVVQPGFTNEELRELVETYKQAKEAAIKADEITKQEDCGDDGVKKGLEDRIAELERRLELVESGTLEECSLSQPGSSTSTDVTDPSAYSPPES